MKITFLGTGTSCGVPTLGCSCKVCRSTNPHDSRLRCAALVETDTTRLLIDCGPDIRQQLMPLPFRRIDGVLLSHMHYDHKRSSWQTSHLGFPHRSQFCLYNRHEEHVRRRAPLS